MSEVPSAVPYLASRPLLYHFSFSEALFTILMRCRAPGAACLYFFSAADGQYAELTDASSAPRRFIETFSLSIVNISLTISALRFQAERARL